MILSETKNEKESETGDEKVPFTYTFNEKEVLTLARFLRKNQNSIPVDIESFARKVELYIYSNMSIDEVEKFYL